MARSRSCSVHCPSIRSRSSSISAYTNTRPALFFVDALLLQRHGARLPVDLVPLQRQDLAARPPAGPEPEREHRLHRSRQMRADLRERLALEEPTPRILLFELGDVRRVDDLAGLQRRAEAPALMTANSRLMVAGAAPASSRSDAY